jgi:hypothetical protein
MDMPSLERRTSPTIWKLSLVTEQSTILACKPAHLDAFRIELPIDDARRRVVSDRD